MQGDENKLQKFFYKATNIGMFFIMFIVALIGLLSVFITAKLNTTIDFAGETTSFVFTTGIFELLISFCILLIIALLSKLIFKRIPAKYLMIPFSFVCMFVFLYWISALQLSPIADQEKIHEVATTFVESGDIWHHLQPTQYIHHFPHQCGISYIFSLIYKVFGIDYMYIQYLNAGLSVINMILIFTISYFLFKNEKVQKILVFILPIFALYFMFFNVHYYGNILGLTLALIAILFAILYLQKENPLYVLFSGIFIAISIIAKSNYMIFLCGLILVLVLHVIKKWQLKLTLIIPLMILSIMGINTIYNTILKEKYEVEFADGVPMITYVYMGMQDAHGITPGWYTNIVCDLYAKYYFETEPTAEESKELIAERLSYFAKNPGEMVKYFSEKIGSTWLNPTFQTVWCSIPGLRFVYNGDYAHYLAYHETAMSMVAGKLYNIEHMIFDSYQILVFIFAAIGIYLSIKDFNLSKSILPIIFIGGFLFHIIWEVKAIYVLQYYFILLPYTALGLNHILEKIGVKIKDLRCKKLNEKN